MVVVLATRTTDPQHLHTYPWWQDLPELILHSVQTFECDVFCTKCELYNILSQIPALRYWRTWGDAHHTGYILKSIEPANAEKYGRDLETRITKDRIFNQFQKWIGGETEVSGRKLTLDVLVTSWVIAQMEEKVRLA